MYRCADISFSVADLGRRIEGRAPRRPDFFIFMEAVFGKVYAKYAHNEHFSSYKISNQNTKYFNLKFSKEIYNIIKNFSIIIIMIVFEEV